MKCFKVKKRPVCVWNPLKKKVTGDLDDCDCDVETIDTFNNDQLYPKLQTLLASDYFRFYKVSGPDLLT